MKGEIKIIKKIWAGIIFSSWHLRVFAPRALVRDVADFVFLYQTNLIQQSLWAIALLAISAILFKRLINTLIVNGG